MRAAALLALAVLLAGCDESTSGPRVTDADSGGSPFDFDAGCSGPLVPGASLTCNMEIEGRVRELLLYAPKAYDSSRPSALVVDAHGSGEDDAQQAGIAPYQDWPAGLGSGFRLVADREGFLVVEPEGFGGGWAEEDTAFLQRIPPFVSTVASVDPRRVYLTGISNGGALVFWTGCQDQGTYRAFAPISAADDDPCPLPRPSPLIQFHTPLDKVIPFDAGQAAFGAWTAASHCRSGPAASWQFGGDGGDARSVCLAQPSPSTWALAPCDAAAPPTTCALYSSCDNGAQAMFCTVPADPTLHFDTTGGHVLYDNATGLSLAAVSWEFWKALP